MSIDIQKPIIPKPLNIEGLQGPVHSFQIQLQVHNQLLQGLLKGIGITTKELNFVEIMPRSKNDTVLYPKYMSEAINLHNSKPLLEVCNYFKFIRNDKEKPYTQRVQEWQVIASENKTNARNFNKDVKPQKIIFDLNEPDKTSTNMAMGPAKVDPQDVKNQTAIVGKTGNASTVDDKENGIKLVYSEKWLLNQLDKLGYFQKIV